jgi:hypothetical protein
VQSTAASGLMVHVPVFGYALNLHIPSTEDTHNDSLFPYNEQRDVTSFQAAKHFVTMPSVPQIQAGLFELQVA